MIKIKPKKINLLILLAFFVACTSLNRTEDKNAKEFNSIDPILTEYVDDFVYLTSPYYDKKILKEIRISINDTKNRGIAGFCKISTIGKESSREIVVDSLYWEQAGKNEREVLMIHEMSHCLCDLGHSHFEGVYEEPAPSVKTLKNGYLEDGCPISIMHPVVVSSQCYEKHREHYRYEIRLRCYARSMNNK